MLFHELLKLDHACAVTADDEMNIVKTGQDFWDDTDENVDSFSVLKARDKHDVDLVWVARLLDLPFSDTEIWRKFVRVYRVWNGESLLRIKFGSEHEVVLAGMTDANCSIQVPK